jgi:hypothetical protein
VSIKTSAVVNMDMAAMRPIRQGNPALFSSEILQETGEESSGCSGTIAVRCEGTQSSLHRRRMGSHGCDRQVAALFSPDRSKGFNKDSTPNEAPHQLRQAL